MDVVARALRRVPPGWLERGRRLVPLFPWLSLATGIGGAILMERTPGRAWLVVAASVIGWGVLVVLNLVERSWQKRLPAEGVGAARVALVMVDQAAVQTALFFPLPFYVKAAEPPPHLQPGHALFFVAYAAVMVVALWDPLFLKAMGRAVPAFAVQAFSAFIGLNMILPVLGMSNEHALLVAGGATAVGVPLLVLLLQGAAWTRRQRLLALPATLLVLCAARFAAPLVPPAPLELVGVEIGSRIVDRELADAAPTHDTTTDLVCHTAIKAPLGLKDELLHAWRRDGTPLDEIALHVDGGRAAGFRTWSRKRPPPSGWPTGRYTCRVQTASGQVLGSASVDVR